MEKLIKDEHLKWRVRALGGQDEVVQEVLEQASTSLIVPRMVINYIHGRLIDDKYNSRKQRRRLLYATSVRESVSIVQCTFTNGSARLIDNSIIFLPIDPSWVILPQKDALVLTLVVDVFDMHRILIDPGSSVDLLQMSTYRQMRYSSSALENLGRILSEFNEATIISLGDVVFPI